MSDTGITAEAIKRLTKYQPLDKITASQLAELGVDPKRIFAVTSLIDEEEVFLTASVMARLQEDDPSLESKFEIRLGISDLSLEEIAGIPIGQEIISARLDVLREIGLLDGEDLNIEEIDLVIKDLYYAACDEPLQYSNKPPKKRSETKEPPLDKPVVVETKKAVSSDDVPKQVSDKRTERRIERVIEKHEKEQDRDERLADERQRVGEKGYLPLGFVLEMIRDSGTLHDVRVSPADARETFEELTRYSLVGGRIVEEENGKYVSKAELENEINRLLTEGYGVRGLTIKDLEKDEPKKEPTNEELEDIENGREGDETTKDEDSKGKVYANTRKLSSLRAPQRRVDPLIAGYRPLQRGRPRKIKHATLISYDEAEAYIDRRLNNLGYEGKELRAYKEAILKHKVIDLAKSIFPALKRRGKIVYKPDSYVKEYVVKCINDIAEARWLESIDGGGTIDEPINKEDL